VRASVPKFVVLAFVLAACSPAPTPPETPPAPVPTRSAVAPTVRPTAPSPTPPTSIDLPPPYDRIAWAHVDANPDASPIQVSIGVLGHPATTTRATVNPDSVRAAGGLILLDVTEDETEVVDAATGGTVARFHPSQLRLSTPDDQISLRDYAPQGLLVDPVHAYLYELDSNEEGLQLRRFALDGSHATLIARLGPDPEDELWTGGMAMGPSGEVDAVVCPSPDSAAADHRCRLYRVPRGVEGLVAPRFLPASTPRLCFVAAASEHFLVGSSYIGCHADGGYPATIPYVAINLRTRESGTTIQNSGFQVFGVQEDDGHPVLIGNATRTLPPFVYPPAAATMTVTGDVYASISSIAPSGPTVADRSAWTVRGITPGLQILESFGPEYAACRLASSADGAMPTCSPGGVFAVGLPKTPNGMIQLPSGTYGEIMPPLDNPAKWSLPPLD
jgi:hypothetical protein